MIIIYKYAHFLSEFGEREISKLGITINLSPLSSLTFSPDISVLQNLRQNEKWSISWLTNASGVLPFDFQQTLLPHACLL